MSVLTQKAQVTVPVEIREKLGLRPGDEVEFDIKNGKIVLHKKVKLELIEKYKGYLGKGKTEDIMEELR